MKKILVLSLVLALVLTLILPSVAMAAKPVKPAAFNASGVLVSIDDGKTKQLGDSGKWLVSDRHIQGTFVSGSLDGDFTLTYGGVFDLATQAGHLAGKMVVGSSSFAVTGKAAPFTFVGWYAEGIPILELTITGNWNYLKGGKGNGTFTAIMDFIPTADGHVAAVLPTSSFVMKGKK
jgi:hypothetical protein